MHAHDDRPDADAEEHQELRQDRMRIERQKSEQIEQRRGIGRGEIVDPAEERRLPHLDRAEQNLVEREEDGDLDQHRQTTRHRIDLLALVELHDLLLLLRLIVLEARLDASPSPAAASSSGSSSDRTHRRAGRRASLIRTVSNMMARPIFMYCDRKSSAQKIGCVKNQNQPQSIARWNFGDALLVFIGLQELIDLGAGEQALIDGRGRTRRNVFAHSGDNSPDRLCWSRAATPGRRRRTARSAAE